MIYGKSTPNHAGIALYGDYFDLRNVHDVVHHLADCPRLDSRFNEFLLGFAYDIRHAYQGDRIVDSCEEFGQSSSTYFGVQIVWPLVPVYIKILRHCASFMPTLRLHQGCLYLLENAVHSALLEASPAVVDRVIAWMDNYPMFSDNYYTDYFNEACKEYLFKTEAGAERLAKLPQILQMLSPISEEYRSFAVYLEETASREGCDPHSLTDRSEWPEYEW